LVICLPFSSRAEDVAPSPKYQAAVQALTPFIEREVHEKKLPALSIALVDDQEIVWAKGFGFANPQAKVPATANTVYRVGSVSKLFTDIAVMQLVERGQLDLDAPVTRYLPNFQPTTNPFHKPITLRQLMTHRSGLVREPPVGHYFDDRNSSLEDMVRSLNRTTLIYEPESRIKYSNAAIGVVGYVLQQTQKEPFAKYLQERLLDPMGMKRSSFEPKPALTRDLAHALMWTYHGREFEAPTFELGIAPAGCMYSTVTDLSRFMSILFAGGRGPNGQILKPETLVQMLTPQFDKPDAKEGFGIGFHIMELEGRRKIGHNGAIYGFATELSALPADKLGVVVVASRDVANAVTTHIADVALRQMLAVRQQKSPPKIEETSPLNPESARLLAGRYKSGETRVIDMEERSGRLWALAQSGGFSQELRAQGDHLIVDDIVAYGQQVVSEGNPALSSISALAPEGRGVAKLRIGKNTYERIAVEKPAPPPDRWLGLIGEYGWDHDILYILEKDGKLYALIEWFFYYPLREISKDVFQFPDYGLYMGEKLIFRRDASGRATEVEAAAVIFRRRPIDGENGETFRIKPLRPVTDLRQEARAARPPDEKGDFRKPDLVDLTTLDDTIKLDIRYATTNNFLSTPFYTSARAFLQRPAAEALVRVHKKLAEQGYGLLIHDGYRPWSVTKMFWEATPEKQRIFVANPAQGSRHNRGCAVDLTLYDRATGKPIQMVGGYDEMSDRSYPAYPGGTSLQRWHRDLLRHAMEAQGFTVYEAEWWHFDYNDWRKYPILNLSFEQIEAKSSKEN
jgi:CubicO group peptidase (beta-lactamase class C family)/D-alanyl-D-alanine dipeptidase